MKKNRNLLCLFTEISWLSCSASPTQTDNHYLPNLSVTWNMVNSSGLCHQISPIFHCRILSALIPKRLFRARDWITLDPHLFDHPLDHPKWRSTFWTPKNTPGFRCGFPERYKNSLTLQNNVRGLRTTPSVNLREKRGVQWRLDGASRIRPNCHVAIRTWRDCCRLSPGS